MIMMELAKSLFQVFINLREEGDLLKISWSNLDYLKK